MYEVVYVPTEREEQRWFLFQQAIRAGFFSDYNVDDTDQVDYKLPCTCDSCKLRRGELEP